MVWLPRSDNSWPSLRPEDVLFRRSRLYATHSIPNSRQQSSWIWPSSMSCCTLIVGGHWQWHSEEMDASKLRLRRQIPTGADSVLPLRSNSYSQGISPSTGNGKIHTRQKRLRRRTRLKAALRTCLKGAFATLVSGSLSLLLLPFSWTQGMLCFVISYAVADIIGLLCLIF
jgi:hypothetical protein